MSLISGEYLTNIEILRIAIGLLLVLYILAWGSKYAVINKVNSLSSLSNTLIIVWATITGSCYYALTSLELGMVKSEFGAIENGMYTEHGFMENLQVFLLTLACVGFIYTVRNSKAFSRDLSQFLALLMVAFIVRELGINAISDTKVILFKGDIRLLYVVPLFGLILKMLFNCKFYFKHLRIFMATRSFQYLGLSAIFYGVISRGFEKGYFLVSNSGFWEESVEIAACLLLVAIGCRTIGPDLAHIRAKIEQ